MIMSTARDYIQPSKEAESKKLIEKLIIETRKEEGNEGYTLYKDRENEGEYVLLEFWDSQESLDRHFKTEHFMSIVPEIQKLQVKPSEVNTYVKEIEYD